jgi:hypothetical protein
MYYQEEELPDWLPHLVQQIPSENRAYFFYPDPDLKRGMATGRTSLQPCGTA